MKYIYLLLLSSLLLLTGCQSMNAAYMDDSGAMYGDALSPDMPEESATDFQQMLIWTGNITMEVASISNATEQIKVRTKEFGGYIESSEQYDHNNRPSSSMKLRVPSNKLSELLNTLDGVGEVTSKSLSSEDVTERYIDLQARLETNKQLRDRLRKLLDRAEQIKDVLAIEKELTRVQADIDSMTAFLKSMKGKVDYASLTVRLNAMKQEQVPGPLGYIWNGTAWCIKKLFIWQDETYIQQ